MSFISVVVATSAVLIGIAAKPFVENLLSGMLISFSNPIRIGDTVIIDGIYGTVEDVTITHTIIKEWNWRRYIITNSRMLQKDVVNCSITDNYQWAHVEFWVDYDTDLESVGETAIAAATRSQYYTDYEPPRFWIMEMEKEAVKCWVAAWADSPTDAWQLTHEIRTYLVLKLKESGIRTHRYEMAANPMGLNK
ncbi:MAG: mechanosensitive ion channel [Proteobacteria bacterium]|nr:mechanosensitive ion channel [Pseudomonadota bacterium]